MDLLQSRGAMPTVVTRRYPVELTRLKEKLFSDLERGFDFVLHLGQSPGQAQLQLEAVAINVAGMTEAEGDDFGPLIPGAPVGYRSEFPLGRWANLLRQNGVPASVSFHAGTYLCNAAMYLSHYWFDLHGLDGRVGFIHLPLTSNQVLSSGRPLPSLPVSQMSRAIGIVLDRIQGDSTFEA